MKPTNAKVIVVTGKGGAGKTTFTALLASALLPYFGQARTLLIDGDPDLNLHLLLGIPEPKATVADIKDEPLKARDVRQSGKTAVEYVRDRLARAGVIGTHRIGSGILTFDFMAMGVGRDNGCYCAINNALAGVFGQIQNEYDLIIIDSPAGTEHLSRQRIKHADLFCVLQTDASASKAVARRILETAARAEMTIGHTMLINNLPPAGGGIGQKSDLRIVGRKPGQTEVEMPYSHRLAAGDLPHTVRGSGSYLTLATHQMARLVSDLIDPTVAAAWERPQLQLVALQLVT
jgi:CO dehydrogenase maturation factor